MSVLTHACRQAPEKSDKEITSEIQAIIRQITASVTFLPLLNDACKLHYHIMTSVRYFANRSLCMSPDDQSVVSSNPCDALHPPVESCQQRVQHKRFLLAYQHYRCHPESHAHIHTTFLLS